MYTLLIVDDEPNILIGMKALIDWEAMALPESKRPPTVRTVWPAQWIPVPKLR